MSSHRAAGAVSDSLEPKPTEPAAAPSTVKRLAAIAVSNDFLLYVASAGAFVLTGAFVPQIINGLPVVLAFLLAGVWLLPNLVKRLR
jgi:hypothetical protein